MPSANACQRPGGLELTRRLLAPLGLAPGATVLDVGCGSGATVAFLRETFGLDAWGVDVAARNNVPFVLQADAVRLPFPAHHFDVLLFECSLSRMVQPADALAEAQRVLKPGGPVLLSDLYTKGEAVALEGLVGRVAPLPAQLRQFEAAGFSPAPAQIHDDLLASYWAQLVFQHGPQEALRCLGMPASANRAPRWGYYSVVLHPVADTENTDSSCAIHHSTGISSPKPVLRDKSRLPAKKAKKNTDRHNHSAVSPLRAWAGRLAGLGPSPGADEFHRWQLSQAAAMARHAFASSPFYKAHLADVNLAGLDSDEAFLHLPFTDAPTLAAQGERMLCVSLGEVARVRSIPTSGSTGKPKRMWFTNEDLERTIDFFSVGMRQIAPQGRPVVILMSTAQPDSMASLLRAGLARNGINTHIRGRPQCEADVEALEGGAGCLVGMPADILYLCRKRPDLRPAAVLLSADYISPALVRQIEAAWGCRVFSHYGLTETGYGLAVQCAARGSQHLRMADYLVEIVHPGTGIPLPPGQPGEIVLTSLRRRALPLIRYRTGDISSLQADTCGCGCSLPRLGPVLGRWDYLCHDVNIHRLDDILCAIDGLAGYQATWENGRLHLTLEGAQPKAAELSVAIGCPVSVCYGTAPPWLIAGKKCVASRR